MDSSKGSIIQNCIVVIVSNLKLDYLPATFRADNPAGATFSHSPCFGFSSGFDRARFGIGVCAIHAGKHTQPA